MSEGQSVDISVLSANDARERLDEISARLPEGISYDGKDEDEKQAKELKAKILAEADAHVLRSEWHAALDRVAASADPADKSNEQSWADDVGRTFIGRADTNDLKFELSHHATGDPWQQTLETALHTHRQVDQIADIALDELSRWDGLSGSLADGERLMQLAGVAEKMRGIDGLEQFLDRIAAVDHEFHPNQLYHFSSAIGREAADAIAHKMAGRDVDIHPVAEPDSFFDSFWDDVAEGHVRDNMATFAVVLASKLLDDAGELRDALANPVVFAEKGIQKLRDLPGNAVDFVAALPDLPDRLKAAAQSFGALTEDEKAAAIAGITHEVGVGILVDRGTSLAARTVLKAGGAIANVVKGVERVDVPHGGSVADAIEQGGKGLEHTVPHPDAPGPAAVAESRAATAPAHAPGAFTGDDATRPAGSAAPAPDAPAAGSTTTQPPEAAAGAESKAGTGADDANGPGGAKQPSPDSDGASAGPPATQTVEGPASAEGSSAGADSDGAGAGGFRQAGPDSTVPSTTVTDTQLAGAGSSEGAAAGADSGGGSGWVGSDTGSGGSGAGSGGSGAGSGGSGAASGGSGPSSPDPVGPPSSLMVPQPPVVTGTATGITARAGGIESIHSEIKDFRRTTTIEGRVKDSMGERAGFEHRGPSATDVGLPGYHKAHLWGPGFGDEALDGISFVPSDFNLKWQNAGVEDRIRELHALAKPAGATIHLKAEVTTHTLPKGRMKALAEVRYEVTVVAPNGERRLAYKVHVEVDRPPSGRVHDVVIDEGPAIQDTSWINHSIDPEPGHGPPGETPDSGSGGKPVGEAVGSVPDGADPPVVVAGAPAEVAPEAGAGGKPVVGEVGSVPDGADPPAVVAGAPAEVAPEAGAGGKPVVGEVGSVPDGADPPVVVAGAPNEAVLDTAAGSKSQYSNNQKGYIGELMLEQFLDSKGFEVYRDWDKGVNFPGVDTIAYDPQKHVIYLIDNKAQSQLINEASALSIKQLGNANLDQVRGVLDSHMGLSDRAREAFLDGRVEFVMANAHPDFLGTGFSTKIFERGWKALDIVTGEIYGNVQAFRAARAQFSSGAFGDAHGGLGQRGFATVGGMLFGLVAIGGTVYALSHIHSLEDLGDFAIANATSAGITALAAKATGSLTLGGLIAMIVSIPNDQGSGYDQENFESEMAERFLRSTFTAEQIAEGGWPLHEEARAFLFHTPPWVLELKSDGSPAGDLAITTIRDLEAGDNPLELLGTAMAGSSSVDTARYVAILQEHSNIDGTDYFSALLAWLSAADTDLTAVIASRLMSHSDSREVSKLDEAGSDGADQVTYAEGDTDGSDQVTYPEGDTDGSDQVTYPEGDTDGSDQVTYPEGDTDGSDQVTYPEGDTDGSDQVTYPDEDGAELVSRPNSSDDGTAKTSSPEEEPASEAPLPTPGSIAAPPGGGGAPSAPVVGPMGPATRSGHNHPHHHETAVASATHVQDRPHVDDHSEREAHAASASYQPGQQDSPLSRIPVESGDAGSPLLRFPAESSGHQEGSPLSRIPVESGDAGSPLLRFPAESSGHQEGSPLSRIPVESGDAGSPLLRFPAESSGHQEGSPLSRIPVESAVGAGLQHDSAGQQTGSPLSGIPVQPNALAATDAQMGVVDISSGAIGLSDAAGSYIEQQSPTGDGSVAADPGDPDPIGQPDIDTDGPSGFGGADGPSGFGTGDGPSAFGGADTATDIGGADSPTDIDGGDGPPGSISVGGPLDTHDGAGPPDSHTPTGLPDSHGGASLPDIHTPAGPHGTHGGVGPPEGSSVPGPADAHGGVGSPDSHLGAAVPDTHGGVGSPGDSSDSQHHQQSSDQGQRADQHQAQVNQLVDQSHQRQAQQEQQAQMQEQAHHNQQQHESDHSGGPY